MKKKKILGSHTVIYVKLPTSDNPSFLSILLMELRALSWPKFWRNFKAPALWVTWGHKDYCANVIDSMTAGVFVVFKVGILIQCRKTQPKSGKSLSCGNV